MDPPSTYARSYRIVLPNGQGTVSPKKSSFSSTISEPLSISGLQQLHSSSSPSGGRGGETPSSSSSSFSFPTTTQQPYVNSSSSSVHRLSNVSGNYSPNTSPRTTPPSRKLSDREPLPFPPPSFPRVPITSSTNEEDDEEDNDDDEDNFNDSIRGHRPSSSHRPSLSSSSVSLPPVGTISPRISSNNTGGLGFLSPLGNDTSTVISTADSALDLHAEIANAVQRAVAAHNSSWQATLAAAESEWIKNKEETIQRLTQSKDEVYNRDKNRWEKERKELVYSYDNQIKQLQQQLQRAVSDRDEESRKTGTLTTIMEQIRAESIPLASHKAELLALELQLKAREKATEEAVKAMRVTQDQAVGRATVLVRMSEDRLMVAIAAREAELKDTLDKMREEYTTEKEELLMDHENKLRELETRLRKEAEEALTTEQNAHASTKSALARMRGKATMVRALAHVHSSVSASKTNTPPLTTSSSPIPFMPSSPSNSTANSPSPYPNNNTIMNNSSSPGLSSPLNTSETNSSGFFSPVGIIPNNALGISSLSSSMKKELSRTNSMRKDTSPSLVGRIISSSVLENDQESSDGVEILPTPTTTGTTSDTKQSSNDDSTLLNLAPTLDLPEMVTVDTNQDALKTDDISHPDDAEHAEHDRLLDELHEKVDQLGAQLTTITIEHEQLQTDYNNLQDELRTVRMERNDYEDSFRDTKTKYDDLFDTLIVSKHDLEVANETNESLRTTVDQLSSDIAKARNENDVLHEEVIRLRPAAAKGVVDHEQAIKLREQLALALLALATDIAVQLPSSSSGSVSSIDYESKEGTDTTNTSFLYQGNMIMIPPMNRLQPLTDELQNIMKTVDYSTKTILDTVSKQQSRITEQTVTDNQPTLRIGTKVVESPIKDVSDNVQQYVESRLPSYLTVLEALKQLFVLGDEMDISSNQGIVSPTVATTTTASNSTAEQENGTAEGLDTFSDDGEDDEGEEEENIQAEKGVKPPVESAKTALSFVQSMLKAAETTVERQNIRKASLGTIPSYRVSTSDTIVSNDSLPPVPLILPEIHFEALFKDLALQRYSGILAILSSITKPSVENMGKKEAWIGLLPAARGLLSFLAILADTTATPKDVIELLQLALDEIPRRETEAQRQAVATTFTHTSSPSSPSAKSSAAPVNSTELSSANEEIIKFDADLAEQLISTADQLRHAAVAAELRHGAALADAALVRESTAVALIRAHTYIQSRDKQCDTVLSYLRTVYDHCQTYQERIHRTESTLRTIEDYVQQLHNVRQDDQNVFNQVKEEWGNQFNIYRGILTKLANEIEALTMFETTRAQFLTNTSTVLSPSSVTPRNPLQHIGAATLLMSATHRAAQKAKSAVARKHADEEIAKTEAETKALAESQIKALQDALNSTPPLPSSPQVTINNVNMMNDSTLNTPSTPYASSSSSNSLLLTPAPPTPYNLRMPPGYSNSNNNNNNRLNDIESSINDTSNTIRIRGDLLVANSPVTNNPLVSPAIAALSSFVNNGSSTNSPRLLPPSTPTQATIKLSHPLPLPILGVTSGTPSSTTKPSRAPPAIPMTTTTPSSSSATFLTSPTSSSTFRVDRYAGGIGTSIPYNNLGESLSAEIVRKQKEQNSK